MLLPITLALVPFLLGAPLAQAPEEPAAREARRRSVTWAGRPLEVRIATGVRTVLVFAAPVQGKAVEVDRTRIQVVDTGERSIILEPLSEPRPGERWTLRVPWAEGRTPDAAEFALVAHPSEVDAELDIARLQVPAPACPAQTACAPCTAMSAADAIASGLVDLDGVRALVLKPFKGAASGFESTEGVSYRASTWVLMDVQIIRPPQHLAWSPVDATLTGKAGEVRVRAIKIEPNKTFPERVRLLVETDVPPPSAGLELTLHLNGPTGAPSFSIPNVTLPPAKRSQP